MNTLATFRKILNFLGAKTHTCPLLCPGPVHERRRYKVYCNKTLLFNRGLQNSRWKVSMFFLSLSMINICNYYTLGTTVMEAIRDAVDDKTEVIYEQYPSPRTLARKDFSFAIVVVGERPYAEMLGDNSELIIPFGGGDLITSVSERIPTLAILISGRPLVLEPKLSEKVDALVAAWLPGSEGGGVADVIFGDYDFAGKLPMTWLRSVKQLSMNAASNGYDPLFPLGFGLTYNKEKSLE